MHAVAGIMRPLDRLHVRQLCPCYGYFKYVEDTTSDNASTKQANALVGYIDDTQFRAGDKCRSGTRIPVIARRLVRALRVADSRVLNIGAPCPCLEIEADPAGDRQPVSNGVTPHGQPSVFVDVDAGVLVGFSAFARSAPTRLGRGRGGDWLSRRVGEDLADQGRD
jgi:hypothetical protein